METGAFLVLCLLCHHQALAIQGRNIQDRPGRNPEQEDSLYFSTILPGTGTHGLNHTPVESDKARHVPVLSDKENTNVIASTIPGDKDIQGNDIMNSKHTNVTVVPVHNPPALRIDSEETENSQKSSLPSSGLPSLPLQVEREGTLQDFLSLINVSGFTENPNVKSTPDTNYDYQEYEMEVIEFAGEVVPICNFDFFCLDKCGDDRQFNPPRIGFVCSCDDQCILYGDCCVDIFQNCFNLSNTERIVNFINDTLHVNMSRSDIADKGLVQAMADYPHNVYNIVPALVSDLGSCEKIDDSTMPTVRLITKCPKNLQDASVRDKCEKEFSPLLSPVSARIQGQCAMFKNHFCATCHGVSGDEIEAWEVKLDCNTTAVERYNGPLTVSVLETFVRDGICRTDFTPRHGSCQPRACNKENVITEGIEKHLSADAADGLCTSEDVMLCKTYISPRNGYRNLHCKRCFHNSTRDEQNPTGVERNPTNDEQNPTGVERNPTNDEQNPTGVERNPSRDKRNADTQQCVDSETGGFRGPPGLIIILDITGQYTDGDGRQFASYSCGESEVFDPSTQVCKQLICAQGYEPYYGTCIQVSDVYFVEPVTQLYPGNWSELKLDFTKSEKKLSCESLAGEVRNKDVNVSSYIINYEQNGNTVRIAQNRENFTDGRIECLENTLGYLEDNLTVAEITVFINSNLLSTTEIVKSIAKKALISGFLETSITSKVLLTTNIQNSEWVCPYGRRLKRLTNFTVEEYKGTAYVMYNKTTQTLFYLFQSVGFERLFYLEDFKFTFSDAVLVCENNELFDRENCTIVAYWLNETYINGSGIVVLSSGIHYNKGDFQIVEGRVFVCTDFYAERHILEEDSTYLIVSWVFTVVTILFLLTMVLCYCMFPELCTLPGKMTASLAGTMMFTFLFNLFTLVELHHEYVCPVAAALSHLVTLAHFGWMSAIAVNMALTFGPGSISRINTLSNNKAFIRYNVVVWGSSFIIVLTSVILDIVHSDSSSDLQDQIVFADNNTDVHSEDETKPGHLASSSSPSSSSMDFPLYGYPYCTWFSGPVWSRLAFVVIPYFITFFINVVSFILTLVGIQRSSQGAVKLGKKSNDRVRCLIYIKLSTAMGFSWSLSLLTNFVEKNEVLPYIYITLVLLQGVLLFLAFMVNKRVYSLITSRGAALVEKTKTTSLSAVRSQDTRSKNIL